MRHGSKLATGVGAVAVVAALGMAVAPPAGGVQPPPSHLVVTDGNNPLAINVASSNQGVVTAQLDPTTCFNALGTGQTYAITSQSDTSTVSVSPSESGALQCAGQTKKNLPDSQAFTVTVDTNAVCGLGSFASNVYLNPVAGPNGIQNKMTGPLDVTVNVSGIPDCTSSGNPPPPPVTGANPAAPAVANAYLNAAAGQDLASTCRSLFGKNWRGTVISAVAAWMPRPESIKDDPAVAGIWISYVRTEVDHICGYAGANELASADIPTGTTPPLPAYNP